MIDPAIEFAKQFRAIEGAVAKQVKKVGGKGYNIGAWQLSIAAGNGGVLTIEHDGGPLTTEDWADLIRSHRMEVTSLRNWEGQYDWTSDTYQRPVSMIWFKYSIKG